MVIKLGPLIRIVHGEAEGQGFEEKKWVAHVVLNRLKNPTKFRSLEADFSGMHRKWCVSDVLERRAFDESARACIEALEEHQMGIDPTEGATFFATKYLLGNRDPSQIFGVLVEEIEVPPEFAHRFFRLKKRE